MPVLGVTGATGQLGRLTIDSLLAAGATAADVVAIARDSDRARELARLGVQVRQGDYDDPASLPAAVAGLDALFLISGNAVGQRVPQHAAVIDAARGAGVGRVVYTSAPRADVTGLILAPEHLATERLLQESGLRYTILRNGWYFENYTAQIPQLLQTGTLLHATRGHRLAAAARADFAAAAATVLTGAGHDNQIYELAGDGFTMDEFAAAVSEETGTTVTAREVSGPELIAALESAGVPASDARFVASLDESIARDELGGDPATLKRLVGRELIPLREAIRTAV
ncbi:MAG TPA: NAD(P)H-binding protein [Jatrophihabitans sp.]|nr:NAD(P)H-binding protein [Jatrophihabitans sp.]